jgi:hypothetical protein
MRVWPSKAWLFDPLGGRTEPLQGSLTLNLILEAQDATSQVSYVVLNEEVSNCPLRSDFNVALQRVCSVPFPAGRKYAVKNRP